MPKRTIFWLLLSLFFIIGLTASLTSCSSGGGGDSTETGQVAVLITDGPTAEFDEVNVTLTKIELLGDNGRVTLFSQPAGETINLLDFRDDSTLFTLDESVPVGWYSKVRLEVTQVVLVQYDSETGEKTEFEAKLPANGKIDLNPQGPFYVGTDRTVWVSLDMDAEKSLQVKETGSEKYMFRPVVFIDVMSNSFFGKPLRISGTVVEVQDNAFLLDPHSHNPRLPSDQPLQVLIDSNTAIFSQEGELVDLSALSVGDQVTVIGPVVQSDAEGSLCQIQALVVEIGTWLRLGGTIVSDPVTEDGVIRFDCQLDLDGAVQGTAQVQLLEGASKILDPDGNILSVSDLLNGLSIRFDAIVLLDSTTLRSALVVIPTLADNDVLEGTLTSISDSQLTVTTAEAIETCAQASEDAVYFSLTDSGSSYTMTPITAADLALNSEVRLFGHTQQDDCFLFDSLFVIQ